MTPTAQTPPAEWLPRGLAALDERFAKAKAEKYTVKTLADRKFAVTNGEGGAYEVDFTATNTGVCNCPDFQSRGGLLHACKHTARIVLEQWPAAYERYQAKVRELATASITAEVEAAQSAPAEPAPSAQPPMPGSRDLITAVVTATLSRAMTEVIEALEAKTAAIAEAVVAELAKEGGQ
jgi:uncharacterized Zn finger protein